MQWLRRALVGASCSSHECSSYSGRANIVAVRWSRDVSYGPLLRRLRGQRSATAAAAAAVLPLQVLGAEQHRWASNGCATASTAAAAAPSSSSSSKSTRAISGSPHRRPRRGAHRRRGVVAEEMDPVTSSKAGEIIENAAGGGPAAEIQRPGRRSRRRTASTAASLFSDAEAKRSASSTTTSTTAAVVRELLKGSDDSGSSRTSRSSTSGGPAVEAATSKSKGLALLAASAKARIAAQVHRKRLLLQKQRSKSGGAAAAPAAGVKPSSKSKAAANAAVASTTLKRRGVKSGLDGADSRGGGTMDVLLVPDYREQVLRIFEQLAEINSALGERYKAASYQSTVDRLKRGDAIFSLLPPNLLPLPDAAVMAGVKNSATSTADTCSSSGSSRAGEEDATFPKKRQQAVDLAENMRRREMVLSSRNLIPGVGDKLRRKIVEILRTGDLAELHVLEAKPVIQAIREITQIHGFGPRTAIHFYKTFGIQTVEELREYAAKRGELHVSRLHGRHQPSTAAEPCGSGAKKKPEFHLTDAQRLGLLYCRDMAHRIPHAEGRLHEAYLKLRLRRHLGKLYKLTVCGSYRRSVESAGDIDVLLTCRSASEAGKLDRRRKSGRAGDDAADNGSASLLPSQVLEAFVEGLKADKYIEATLAQGPTKFMGLSRLRALQPSSSTSGTAADEAAATAAKSPRAPRFRARRIDIRYVDRESYPAALLYFTGSKTFNVFMRSEAIKKQYILNEYGLFKNPSSDVQGTAKVHDMITKLARHGFATVDEAAGRNQANRRADDGGEGANDGASASSSSVSSGGSVKKRAKPLSKEQLAEVQEMARAVAKLRVATDTEEAIFEKLGMDYVDPKDRNV